jgi:adenine C2-methylase RlmN of 23S rRNA A2503 and tRNA A37
MPTISVDMAIELQMTLMRVDEWVRTACKYTHKNDRVHQLRTTINATRQKLHNELLESTKNVVKTSVSEKDEVSVQSEGKDEAGSPVEGIRIRLPEGETLSISSKEES